jgi:CDP-diacylglycerol--glycerol-3-phosphate 3-phosphatidyltransferase
MDIRRLTLLPAPLKSAFLDRVDPVADWCIRRRIPPNTITALSAVVLLTSGSAFGLGAPRIGAALLLLSGFLDLVDGKVARRGNLSTKFGAVFDSTLDRLGEAALFSGIGIYFVTTPGQRWPILGLGLCLAALSGAFLVSYARARAEGLQLDCRVGIAQRPERIIGLGGPTLFFGAGPSGYLLLGIMIVLAVVSYITVVQRVAHVYRITQNGRPEAAGPPPRPSPTIADPVGKGS